MIPPILYSPIKPLYFIILISQDALDKGLGRIITVDTQPLKIEKKKGKKKKKKR